MKESRKEEITESRKEGRKEGRARPGDVASKTGEVVARVFLERVQ
jgi:hypothetical protein